MVATSPSEFCAALSVAHEEPIAGTAAASTSVWLAFEVDGAWPHDAMQAAAVPEALRHSLRSWATAVPGFRPQALRRPGCDDADAPTVYLALTGPDRSITVELAMESLEALAQLDLRHAVERLRADGALEGARVVERPMIWVCAHGKRDRCCAKWGVPVFEALSQHDDVEVWQTSHLGGHRFAATLLCVPHGVCYGRVGPEHVEALVRAQSSEEVFSLAHLRGRTCWSSSGQAAAHFVREATGIRGVDALEVVSETPGDAGVSVAVVRAETQRFEVRVERRELGSSARPSCAKDPAPVAGWFLVQLRAIA